MPLPLAGALIWGGKLLAELAIWEGISAVLEHFAGEVDPGNEPEAIFAELTKAQEEATRATMRDMGADARQQDFLASTFHGIEPRRGLTELSLFQQGVFDDKSDADRYPTLNYVSQRVGISPQELIQRSNPSRMGDLSALQNSLPYEITKGQYDG